jgi:TonB family protein
MFTQALKPPSGTPRKDTENYSRITPNNLFIDEQPQPDRDSGTVPPMDTEAPDLGIVSDIPAPVAQTDLKNIPKLEMKSGDSLAVQPRESYKESVDGSGTDVPGNPLVEPARLLKQVIPVYPPKARLARVQGSVVLKAMISESGAVEEIAVVEGHPMLIGAAVEAVRHWRYAPARLHGIPTPSPLNITVNFRLNFQ